MDCNGDGECRLVLCKLENLKGERVKRKWWPWFRVRMRRMIVVLKKRSGGGGGEGVRGGCALVVVNRTCVIRVSFVKTNSELVGSVGII